MNRRSFLLLLAGAPIVARQPFAGYWFSHGKAPVMDFGSGTPVLLQGSEKICLWEPAQPEQLSWLTSMHLPEVETGRWYTASELDRIRANRLVST